MEEVVEDCCNKMFSRLNEKVKKGINDVTNNIYRMEDKSYKYREDLMEKYRQFIKYQIKHRLDIFYNNRRLT